MSETKRRDIHWGAAEEIGELHDFDQIVIVARDTRTGEEAVTTWGKSDAASLAAAHIGEFLMSRVMGWSEDALEQRRMANRVRLAEAAGDLLGALKGMVRVLVDEIGWSPETPWIEVARAAIAKAEGDEE